MYKGILVQSPYWEMDVQNCLREWTVIVHSKEFMSTAVDTIDMVYYIYQKRLFLLQK